MARRLQRPIRPLVLATVATVLGTPAMAQPGDNTGQAFTVEEEEWENERRRHVGAVADDLGVQEAQPQDWTEELDTSAERDPDRNPNVDHRPRGRPPNEKPPARCQDRVVRGVHRSGEVRVSG